MFVFWLTVFPAARFKEIQRFQDFAKIMATASGEVWKVDEDREE